MLGRYEIIRLLGSGGMGEVYLAQDTSLGRKAAIKVLSAELTSDKRHLDRFIREARSASALNHPSICTIYEINTENQPPYIAMEYIEGEALSTRISSAGKPELTEAVRIALQVADGLAEAHEAGIVHRDRKPAN